MKPLIVGRAGAIEKCLLLATAAIGIVGALSTAPISGALDTVIGAGAPVYFATTMVLPGALGFWVVRHSRRDRIPSQIDAECRNEALALSGIMVGWSGFLLAAVLAGWQAVAIVILIGMVCVVGPVCRMFQIWRDLRKLHSAMRAGPKKADPPVAEGP